MKKEIEFNTRKAAFVELNGICSMSGLDSHDFIEVTEWSNGEGWDICINAVGNTQTFGITWGQFQAMKKLIKKLDQSYESKIN